MQPFDLVPNIIAEARHDLASKMKISHTYTENIVHEQGENQKETFTEKKAGTLVIIPSLQLKLDTYSLHRGS